MKELIINQDPKSPIAEIFRTLRTNLQFMTSNQGLKTVLVTSSNPSEGKSWVSANLAVAFAQEGKKVVIVDSDMRKGRLHTIFKTDKKPGLSNYLCGISELEDKENVFCYLKNTDLDNLYIMPAGDVPPNPSELLVSDKMTEFIKQLELTFDVVIFDGTPCMLVTDSLILARQVDTTLLVTAYKSTKTGDIEKVKKMIENVGGKIAGIVINKIPVVAKKYDNTYYYGGNSNDEKKDKQQQKINTAKKEQQGTNDQETLRIEVQNEIEKEIEEFIQEEDNTKDEKHNKEG